VLCLSAVNEFGEDIADGGVISFRQERRSEYTDSLYLVWIASSYACYTLQVWLHVLEMLGTSQTLSAKFKGQWIMINADDVAPLGAGPKSRTASCCCVHGWPDSLTWPRLPPSTDPEQISTGNKTTYSPDTFCSWAIKWQDTAFVFGVSGVLVWAWRPHWGHFCGIRGCAHEILRYLKTNGVVLACFPDDILGVHCLRPLWDFMFWGRRVCYGNMASCRLFGKPGDSIFRVKIISRPGEVGRMRNMDKMVRVWLAPIKDRGPEEGGKSTAAGSCSFPLPIFFIRNDFPPAAIY